MKTKHFSNSHVWWLFWAALVMSATAYRYSGSTIDGIILFVVAVNGIGMAVTRYKIRKAEREARDFVLKNRQPLG